MMQEIKGIVEQACHELFGMKFDIELSRPDEKFGDYTTNVAMHLSKNMSKPANEIAELITAKLKRANKIADAIVAGGGFINITLSNQYLWESVSTATTPLDSYKNKKVVVEYSDPNPFKVLHAGHLYTSVVGDAIANLYANAGAVVHRVNFGGDIGLHVAKTMWSIINKLGGEKPESLLNIEESGLVDWMSEAYVSGTLAYDDDEKAKQEIIQLNKRLYEVVESKDESSNLGLLYKICRDWNYNVYFKSFYASIGTRFDKFYRESETSSIGLIKVKEQLKKGVFEKSNGAVVFSAEKYGLHTRVFINSEGLPTYETKDVGLIFKKKEDYDFDISVVITGSDIIEYMKVMLKAVEQFAPELVSATRHITHGIVKLEGGQKMSSRKGNILRAVDVLEATRTAHDAAIGSSSDYSVLAAVKYSFLKHRIGADIIYNPDESVSVLGNSGPYLQYAHARAASIITKAGKQTHSKIPADLMLGERGLARKISEYPEIVTKATEELMPHHICNYLYELAQSFNRFYENNRVIGDERQAIRLSLVSAYKIVLKDGLTLLNIEAPDKI